MLQEKISLLISPVKRYCSKNTNIWHTHGAIWCLCSYKKRKK